MVFGKKELDCLMRIGIDARLYNESGVGRYIRNLLFNLAKLDKENEYFVFLLEKDFNNLSFSDNFQKVRSDFKWYGISEQVKFPKFLKKYNLDLMHFPHFNVPIFYRGKFIVTIHDLIHQHFSMNRATTLNPLTYKLKQFGYKKVFSNAVKNSKEIITVSEYVKKQLENEWDVSSEKITVTTEGVDENIMNLSRKIDNKEIEKILEKFKIKKTFLFYIGNAHPHKNVEGLIKAFLEVRKIKDLQLVLSGNDHYFWKRVKEEHKFEDIIYTGFISDKELVALYKSAKAFVMPSFEEGFGIPLLEAFACGCPVISSNAGSLPEVGGESAIYFDPENEKDLENKILEILVNENLRKELIKKGEQRCKEFSWEKLTKETLKIYKRI